jgi:hypothetical protein
MDRAFGFYPNGWGFESLGGYQILLKTSPAIELLDPYAGKSNPAPTATNPQSLCVFRQFIFDGREQISHARVYSVIRIPRKM